jgi:hypothetical protein
MAPGRKGKVMAIMKTIFASACLGAALSAALPGPRASAFEGGHNPDTLAGVTIGGAPGASPPPGWYFANNLSYQSLTVHNDKGDKIPINVRAWIENPILVWAPDVQILGAQYSASLVQPLVSATTTNNAVPGLSVTNTQTGIFNTVVTPINLSWNLKNGLFVSTGLTVYVPNGTDNKRSAVNIGNNWWTISPDVAISYLKDDWNLSFKSTLDINAFSKDSDFGVTSGNILVNDFTAAKTFGKWKFGVGGFYSQQLNNDRGPSGSPVGKTLQRVGLGPVLGYNVGPVSFDLYYTRDIVTKNAGGGDAFWFAFSTPLQW